MLLNICRHFRTSSVLGIRRTLQYNKPRVFRDPAASQYPVYVEEEADETLELDDSDVLETLVKEERLPKSAIEPEEVSQVLEAERAKNIEIVRCDNPQSPYQYLVIASPYNQRHGTALVETVRRYFVHKYSFGGTNPRKRENANGWYVLDFHNGTLHIMNEELREKYNLAKVWSDDDEGEQWEPFNKSCE